MSRNEQEIEAMKSLLQYLNETEGTSFQLDHLESNKIDENTVNGKIPDFDICCEQMNILAEIVRAAQNDNYAAKKRLAEEVGSEISKRLKGKVIGLFSLDIHPGNNLMNKNDRDQAIRDVIKWIEEVQSSSQIGVPLKKFVHGTKHREEFSEFILIKRNNDRDEVVSSVQFPSDADDCVNESARHLAKTQIKEANEKFLNYSKTGYTNLLVIDNRAHFMPHSISPKRISDAIKKAGIDRKLVNRIFIIHPWNQVEEIK